MILILINMAPKMINTKVNILLIGLFGIESCLLLKNLIVEIIPPLNPTINTAIIYLNKVLFKTIVSKV